MKALLYYDLKTNKLKILMIIILAFLNVFIPKKAFMYILAIGVNSSNILDSLKAKRKNGKYIKEDWDNRRKLFPISRKDLINYSYIKVAAIFSIIVISTLVAKLINNIVDSEILEFILKLALWSFALAPAVAIGELLPLLDNNKKFRNRISTAVFIVLLIYIIFLGLHLLNLYSILEFFNSLSYRFLLVINLLLFVGVYIFGDKFLK